MSRLKFFLLFIQFISFIGRQWKDFEPRDKKNLTSAKQQKLETHFFPMSDFTRPIFHFRVPQSRHGDGPLSWSWLEQEKNNSIGLEHLLTTETRFIRNPLWVTLYLVNTLWLKIPNIKFDIKVLIGNWTYHSVQMIIPRSVLTYHLTHQGINVKNLRSKNCTFGIFSDKCL